MPKVSVWYGKQLGTKSNQNIWGVVRVRSSKRGCKWKTGHNGTIFVSLWYYSLGSKEFLYCRWGTPWYIIWPVYMSDPTQSIQLRVLILPIGIKTETLSKVSIWYRKQLGTKSDQNCRGVVQVRSRKLGFKISFLYNWSWCRMWKKSVDFRIIMADHGDIETCLV